MFLVRKNITTESVCKQKDMLLVFSLHLWAEQPHNKNNHLTENMISIDSEPKFRIARLIALKVSEGISIEGLQGLQGSSVKSKSYIQCRVYS